MSSSIGDMLDSSTIRDKDGGEAARVSSLLLAKHVPLPQQPTKVIIDTAINNNKINQSDNAAYQLLSSASGSPVVNHPILPLPLSGRASLANSNLQIHNRPHENIIVSLSSGDHRGESTRVFSSRTHPHSQQEEEKGEGYFAFTSIGDADDPTVGGGRGGGVEETPLDHPATVADLLVQQQQQQIRSSASHEFLAKVLNIPLASMQPNRDSGHHAQDNDGSLLFHQPLIAMIRVEGGENSARRASVLGNNAYGASHNDGFNLFVTPPRGSKGGNYGEEGVVTASTPHIAAQQNVSPSSKLNASFNSHNNSSIHNFSTTTSTLNTILMQIQQIDNEEASRKAAAHFETLAPKRKALLEELARHDAELRRVQQIKLKRALDLRLEYETSVLRRLSDHQPTVSLRSTSSNSNSVTTALQIHHHHHHSHLPPLTLTTSLTNAAGASTGQSKSKDKGVTTSLSSEPSAAADRRFAAAVTNRSLFSFQPSEICETAEERLKHTAYAKALAGEARRQREQREAEEWLLYPLKMKEPRAMAKSSAKQLEALELEEKEAARQRAIQRIVEVDRIQQEKLRQQHQNEQRQQKAKDKKSGHRKKKMRGQHDTEGGDEMKTNSSSTANARPETEHSSSSTQGTHYDDLRALLNASVSVVDHDRDDKGKMSDTSSSSRHALLRTNTSATGKRLDGSVRSGRDSSVEQSLDRREVKTTIKREGEGEQEDGQYQETIRADAGFGGSGTADPLSSSPRSSSASSGGHSSSFSSFDGDDSDTFWSEVENESSTSAMQAFSGTAEAESEPVEQTDAQRIEEEWFKGLRNSASARGFSRPSSSVRHTGVILKQQQHEEGKRTNGEAGTMAAAATTGHNRRMSLSSSFAARRGAGATLKRFSTVDAGAESLRSIRLQPDLLVPMSRTSNNTNNTNNNNNSNYPSSRPLSASMPSPFVELTSRNITDQLPVASRVNLSGNKDDDGGERASDTNTNAEEEDGEEDGAAAERSSSSTINISKVARSLRDVKRDVINVHAFNPERRRSSGGGVAGAVSGTVSPTKTNKATENSIFSPRSAVAIRAQNNANNTTKGGRPLPLPQRPHTSGPYPSRTTSHYNASPTQSNGGTISVPKRSVRVNTIETQAYYSGMRRPATAMEMVRHYRKRLNELENSDGADAFDMLFPSRSSGAYSPTVAKVKRKNRIGQQQGDGSDGDGPAKKQNSDKKKNGEYNIDEEENEEISLYDKAASLNLRAAGLEEKWRRFHKQNETQTPSSVPTAAASKPTTATAGWKNQTEEEVLTSKDRADYNLIHSYQRAHTPLIRPQNREQLRAMRPLPLPDSVKAHYKAQRHAERKARRQQEAKESRQQLRDQESEAYRSHALVGEEEQNARLDIVKAKRKSAAKIEKRRLRVEALAFDEEEKEKKATDHRREENNVDSSSRSNRLHSYDGDGAVQGGEGELNEPKPLHEDTRLEDSSLQQPEAEVDPLATPASLSPQASRQGPKDALSPSLSVSSVATCDLYIFEENSDCDEDSTITKTDEIRTDPADEKKEQREVEDDCEDDEEDDYEESENFDMKSLIDQVLFGDIPSMRSLSRMRHVEEKVAALAPAIASSRPRAAVGEEGAGEETTQPAPTDNSVSTSPRLSPTRQSRPTTSQQSLRDLHARFPPTDPPPRPDQLIPFVEDVGGELTAKAADLLKSLDVRNRCARTLQRFAQKYILEPIRRVEAMSMAARGQGEGANSSRSTRHKGKGGDPREFYGNGGDAYDAIRRDGSIRAQPGESSILLEDDLFSVSFRARLPPSLSSNSQTLPEGALNECREGGGGYQGKPPMSPSAVTSLTAGAGGLRPPLPKRRLPPSRGSNKLTLDQKSTADSHYNVNNNKNATSDTNNNNYFDGIMDFDADSFKDLAGEEAVGDPSVRAFLRSCGSSASNERESRPPPQKDRKGTIRGGSASSSHAYSSSLRNHRFATDGEQFENILLLDEYGEEYRRGVGQNDSFTGMGMWGTVDPPTGDQFSSDDDEREGYTGRRPGTSSSSYSPKATAMKSSLQIHKRPPTGQRLRWAENNNVINE